MALTVNTNIASLNTQRNLTKSSNALATSMERLSTGSRINSAKDDAAGLQISNRMSNQISGLSVAVRNANDGISMAQTAEGALQQSTNIMQRMRDLALQSANGSNSGQDRQSLQEEFNTLSGELTRIAKTTTFGGKNLLDGSFGNTAFQIGANSNETISFSLSDMSATSLKGSYSSASVDGTATDLSAKVTGNKFDASSKDVTGTDTNVASIAAADIPADGDLATSTLSIDGNAVTLTGVTDKATLVAAINDATETTGVSAELDSDTGDLIFSSTTSTPFEVSGTLVGADTTTPASNTAVAGSAVPIADTETLSIDGTSITMTGVTDLATLNGAIAAAGFTGPTAVTATQDGDGNLVLSFEDTSADIAVSGTLMGGTTTSTAVAAQTTSASATSTYTAGAETSVTGLSAASSISVNGETFSFDQGDDLAAVIGKINDGAGGLNSGAGTLATGVTASDVQGRLVLTSADGKNIELKDAAAGAGSLARLGLGAGKTEAGLASATSITLNGTEIKFNEGDNLDKIVTTINNASTGVTASKNAETGTLELFSEDTFTVADGTVGNGLAALGLEEGTNESITQESNLSNINISSAENSQMAVQVLDEALQMVDSVRAELGAVQNRFDNTISNLQNISENVSAARGRIQDTDFAAETANLSKNQILQQAGTAILAQAKQLPQAVLSLLQ
ncbi:flagellin [Stutzerimonas kunmingensis]|jgi:flagellin|uniref:flagellin N-terminal helical domain-containing protein n=1 Tax=Stutzerimonas stutzeri subgroup TaxID=578833 RepID=UPI0028ABC0F2|nr:flagellin [Stutzerimonas kunmingensis]